MKIIQQIQSKIFEIRNQKVLLDFSLAELYEVETRILKQAVKRNKHKFPKDFMFELSKKEIEDMVSQFVIPSKSFFGGSRPMAFTEQGVAMLSTILKSKKAIDVNISIMRAFVMLRKYALTYKELTEKIKTIESKFPDIYKALDYLLTQDKQKIEQENRKRIGFKI